MAESKAKSVSPSDPSQSGSTISRYVSFVMLVATILVCGFFFYNVIKGFLLPLFLATLLAVIFRPVHEWIAGKCKGRTALAAALSTSVIMLVVLLPLAGLVTLGLFEANQVVLDRKMYMAKLYEVRNSLGLQKPFANQLDGISTELRKLDEVLREAGSTDEAYLARIVAESRAQIDDQLANLKVELLIAVKDLISDLKDETIRESLDLDRERREVEGLLADATAAKQNLEQHPEAQPPESLADVEEQLKGLRERNAKYIERRDALYALKENRIAIEAYRLRNELVDEIGDRPLKGDTDHMTPEKRSLRYLFSHDEKGERIELLKLIDGFRSQLESMVPDASDNEQSQIISGLEMQRVLGDLQFEYDRTRTIMLGGLFRTRGIELVNPSDDQVDEWAGKLFMGGTRWLPAITNTATSLLVGLLMGLAIMAVALFYFLLDGPKMINTFMRLSPLDDRHELELLQEFDKVSRAVVLATLLSALAQGILGGIGYKLAGLDSVFLLTLLTTVLALVPFVGAAAVWLPCCLYIAFIKEIPDAESTRTWMYVTAGLLATYGFLIISMADNVIKPWVLQGQSKLHPLLALLSVLGGVQALGPIGILVGPMVIAFLQVLLTILQREITSLDAAMKSATE